MDEDLAAYIDGDQQSSGRSSTGSTPSSSASHPGTEVALSYGMAGYRVGRRRLNLGVWKRRVRRLAQRRGRRFVAPPAALERQGTIGSALGMPRRSPTTSCGRWAGRWTPDAEGQSRSMKMHSPGHSSEASTTASSEIGGHTCHPGRAAGSFLTSPSSFT